MDSYHPLMCSQLLSCLKYHVKTGVAWRKRLLPYSPLNEYGREKRCFYFIFSPRNDVFYMFWCWVKLLMGCYNTVGHLDYCQGKAA